MNIGSPTMLKKNEELILSTPNVSLHEPRRVTSGRYGRPSVRIAKGVSVCVGGFGLNGFFSPEEHYARDLEDYYPRSLLSPPQ